MEKRRGRLSGERRDEIASSTEEAAPSADLAQLHRRTEPPLQVSHGFTRR